MNTRPAISIIVPILNEEGNIALLYQEIGRHCPLPFELLWVDDGSTDNSMAEIERLARDDHRVKAISFPGHSATRPRFWQACRWPGQTPY